MVQYNKNLINNKTIVSLKYRQLGGNIFSDLPFIWKVIIIIITLLIIKGIINFGFKLKMHGVIFPIIFGFLGISIYKLLSKHMKVLGLSLTNNSNSNSAKIISIINTISDIIYSIPYLVPVIPKIPNPTFDYQPFKGIRNGIQMLRVPIKVDGEDHRLSINFPKLEIPFMDPLAGICCVWDKLKQLLAVVEKALEGPKKIVEKVFGAIKRVVKKIKDFIMKLVKKIINVVKVITKPIVGLFRVFIKFLDYVLNLIDNAEVRYVKKQIESARDEIQDFNSGNFVGGNKNNKKDPRKLNLNEIIYKIKLLNYEDIHDKKMNNITKKLSIDKIYEIQTSKKQGLIRFVNKYKSIRFSQFINRKLKKFRKENIRRKTQMNYNLKKNKTWLKK